METGTRLHAQIAQEAGVDKKIAQVAAYLSDLSRAGRSLAEAAELMRSDRSYVRTFARDWRIPFPDYTPADPIVLEWFVPEKGALQLRTGGEIVASVFHGDGAKVARWIRATPASFSESGNTMVVAAKRLSATIERRSVELFGCEDIVITMPGQGGVSLRVVPEALGDPAKLSRALAARPIGRPA